MKTHIHAKKKVAHMSSLSLLKPFAYAHMSSLSLLKAFAYAHKGPLIGLKLTRSVPTCPY